MPLDPFDPSALDTGGFDLSSMLGPQSQHATQAQPQLPQAKPQSKWAQVALAALVPIAARKGGRQAVAALLNGMQQEQARRQATDQRDGQQQFENQRQLQGDARLQESANATRQYQQAQLGGAQDARRSALMKEAVTAIQQADSPETVKALLDFYNPQLTQAGVRNPQALNSLASQVATPSAMEQKAATKYIGQLEKTYGQDWASKVGSATFVLPGAPPDPATGKPKAITARELLAKSGLNMQGLPVKPPNANQVNAGSFEDYVIRYAKDVGKTPETLTTQDIQVAKKQYNQADDKPTDPAIAELRALRLEQAKNGGLTPSARANIIGGRRNQWQRFTKPIIDRQQAVAKIDSGLAALDRGNRNAATQTIIFAFNKLQDETSAVREGEYARSEELAPLTSRIEGAIVKLTEGGGKLSDSQLRSLAQEAKATATALEGVSNRAAMDLRQGIEEELGDYQIPTSRVFGGSAVGVRQKPTTTLNSGLQKLQGR